MVGFSLSKYERIKTTVKVAKEKRQSTLLKRLAQTVLVSEGEAASLLYTSKTRVYSHVSGKLNPYGK